MYYILEICEHISHIIRSILFFIFQAILLFVVVPLLAVYAINNITTDFSNTSVLGTTIQAVSPINALLDTSSVVDQTMVESPDDFVEVSQLMIADIDHETTAFVSEYRLNDIINGAGDTCGQICYLIAQRFCLFFAKKTM